MRRDYIRWYSPSLQRDMELLAFGHRGFPLVVFPTSGGRFWEYEERGMIATLGPRIEAGELQVICVDSVDSESWYARWKRPEDRLHRQNGFDAYLTHELTPFVKDRTSWPQYATTGCSLGGYHAVNFALRHPDIVTYAVSMSGAFDIPKRFLDGFYNNDAFFHSPLDYLPGNNDPWFHSHYARNFYVLCVGNGDPLFDNNVRMAHVLGSKHIPHNFEVWDGFVHDWPWWHAMARKFFA